LRKKSIQARKLRCQNGSDSVDVVSAFSLGIETV